jgi:hypothetical protein
MLTTVCHGALAVAALYVCWRLGRFLVLPLFLLAFVLLTLSPVGRTVVGL